MCSSIALPLCGATTFSITTLSIMTLNIKTFRVMGLFATLSINNTQCPYAECRNYLNVRLSVVMLIVMAPTVPPLLPTSGEILTSTDELRFSQQNKQETETSGIHLHCSAINQSINQLPML